ncbi:MAG: RHS repeat-associated core domain-containing protein [Candidatus Aenigmatarchaeota archaeon]
MPKQVWDSKALWLIVLATFTIVVIFSTNPVGFFAPQFAVGKSYVYANGQRVATINETGALTYNHADYLGSVRLVTSESREQLLKEDYTPFGSTLTETGYSSALQNDYKFTGKEQDISGLYYYGARYYNPDIGRFTTVDPAYDPTESPYAYAANNPVKYVDPNGRKVIFAPELTTTLERWRITKEELLKFHVFASLESSTKIYTFRNLNPEDSAKLTGIVDKSEYATGQAIRKESLALIMTKGQGREEIMGTIFHESVHLQNYDEFSNLWMHLKELGVIPGYDIPISSISVFIEEVDAYQKVQDYMRKEGYGIDRSSIEELESYKKDFKDVLSYIAQYDPKLTEKIRKMSEDYWNKQQYSTEDQDPNFIGPPPPPEK